MNNYENNALRELMSWKKSMQKKSSITESLTKGFQKKINGFIPEKIHGIVTDGIKNVTKAVIFGSEYTTKTPLKNSSLEVRENLVREKVDFYKKAAAISGASTGSGGFFLGLADFPILLSLKMKFLFDTASLYGFDVRHYQERLYILYVFQLAFSSQERRNGIFNMLSDWDNYSKGLPQSVDLFDWRTFQQEYRDYIDLAKFFQLLPGIGAVVGAITNYKLIDKLGQTAINTYRMRVFKLQSHE